MQIVITPKRIIVIALICLFIYGAYSLFDIKRTYTLNGFSDKCIYKDCVAYVDNAYCYVNDGRWYKCFNACIDDSGKVNNAMFLTEEESKIIMQKSLYSQNKTNELKLSDDLYAFLNEYGTELWIKEDGNKRRLTCVPDSFLLHIDNMYYENGFLFALSRKNVNWAKDVQCSLWAKGHYNSEQRLIKQDIIIKIDIFNDICEFLYRTDNERERIVSYNENTIATVKGSVLTIRSLKDNSVYNRHFIGIRSDYCFEVCNNRLFVWDGSYELIGSYDTNCETKE